MYWYCRYTLPYSQKLISAFSAPFLRELIATNKVALSETKEPPKMKKACEKKKIFPFMTNFEMNN